MNHAHAILTLNAGSSSLKFALFALEGNALARQFSGEYRGLPLQTEFEVRERHGQTLAGEDVNASDHETALAHLFDWLKRHAPEYTVHAVGHRVVHGGTAFTAPVRVDGDVQEQLHALEPLAPLHMPHNLAAIDILARQQPDLLQVACFDTAFHQHMPLREQYYALPREWFERGVRRYGFHGLSYEYIASVLPEYLGKNADGRIIVAHLGHGASLCALHQRHSVATTMGMTPLDGIPMATRCGSIDPGILIWLQRTAGLNVDAVDDLLNRQSGLLGLSGTSADMRELLADPHAHATEAVDYFVHHTHRAIASLTATLGGLDALVFTAGIGEKATRIRERICREAAWLGIELDAVANVENRARISLPESPVSVWQLPTDEEQIIARHTHLLLCAEPNGERP